MKELGMESVDRGRPALVELAMVSPEEPALWRSWPWSPWTEGGQPWWSWPWRPQRSQPCGELAMASPEDLAMESSDLKSD